MAPVLSPGVAEALFLSWCDVLRGGWGWGCCTGRTLKRRTLPGTEGTCVYLPIPFMPPLVTSIGGSGPHPPPGFPVLLGAFLPPGAGHKSLGGILAIFWGLETLGSPIGLLLALARVDQAPQWSPRWPLEELSGVTGPVGFGC